MIWGDDKLLFKYAIHRQPPLGRFHSIDPFGFFDPYNGYLVVIPRITTKVLTFGEPGYFLFRTYLFSAFTWTVITIYIALLIGRFTRPYLGFFAALIFAIMPYSNRVMLAQVNTLTWPSVLAVIIAVVTRQYPRSRILQVFTSMFFVLVTLSTLMSIVPIIYLIWLVFFRTETVQPIERSLVWVMGGSLLLQVLSYQSRGRSISPSRFIYELLLSSNAFAPQFVREKILESKSAIENIVLYGIPILLGITIFILVRLGNRSELRKQVKIAQHLFLIALLLLCMLIVGNGGLNSHYLFVPTGLFWIGVLLICDAVAHGIYRFRMVPIAVVLVVFLNQLSGIYFVL